MYKSKNLIRFGVEKTHLKLKSARVFGLKCFYNTFTDVIVDVLLLGIPHLQPVKLIGIQCISLHFNALFFLLTV